VNERLAFLREALPSTLPLAFVLASGGFLTLVLKCHASDSWRNLLRPLEGPLRALGVEGLQLNWNPSAGRRVLSSRHQEALYGPGELPSEDGFYGPLSFRQQIPEMENAALAEAEAFLAEARPEAALDLYCGNGATLARWRARGWRAVGVELVGEACSLAARNAPGATILKGKVEQRLPQLDALLGPNFALFTNPPRDGHAPEVNDWILTRRPTRIAYLSCNPRSLARDLTALVEGGYELSSVLPFDFFPNTDHVEALALLTALSSK